MFPESGMANSPVLTEKVGPGVVGETHSMTYDPADISGGTIYVGGDNCGVFKTTNGGWTLGTLQ